MINCSGIAPGEVQQILDILNKIISSQVDPHALMGKLDEALAQLKSMNATNKEQIDAQKQEAQRQEQALVGALEKLDSHCPERLEALKGEITSVIDRPIDLRTDVPRNLSYQSESWLNASQTVTTLRDVYGKLNQETVDRFLDLARKTDEAYNEFAQVTGFYAVVYKQVTAMNSDKAAGQRAFLGKTKFAEVLAEVRADASAKRAAAGETSNDLIARFQATCEALSELDRQLSCISSMSEPTCYNR